MQRQSLGSPTSKLQMHGGEKITGDDDQKRRVIIDGEDSKESKTLRSPFYPSSPSFSLPHKSEKLIPILTLLCFLLLYLNSHSPSQSDLATFNGLKHFDSREIGRFMEIQISERQCSGDSKQKLDKYASKYRLHRKMTDI
ncbi:hypothetical protein like AT2G35470 [Hibiscus trionum]|uniref:Uncharacterized protein n=1 Tax=Hibiscus trionum TaxID=183268 RepID=A0A9W7JLV6_HIBTR|nr:hypothetical protein like AT2G35470 [Hibiscus trionum]